MIRNIAREALRTPLPATFYRDPNAYAEGLRRIFPGSWQFLAGPEYRPEPGHAQPLTLLPGSLEEPLLLSRDDEGR